ncbi:hypothetical protein [Enterococcus canintestini]|uniref:hypothetical protein n=1 Tax=Enterococcus canintestini TaxID=317010 RepID=UPI0008FFEA82|nr:hypothetical protein [Enterococcus canintestini]
MKKMYWLRRIGVLLFMFGIGVFATGHAPTWIKIGFPTAVILWLMIYDETMFNLEIKRREQNGSRRKIS